MTSKADEAVDRLATKVRETADAWAAEGGAKAKLAEMLAEDADFIPKLKPSLIKARAKGELPTDEVPSQPRVAPAAPQIAKKRPTPKSPSGGPGGGPNPFVVIAVALALGIALAKIVDLRGHAHPRV